MAGRYDESNHKQFAPGGDESKRAFTYFVLTGGRFVGAAAVRLAVLKFVLSMTVRGWLWLRLQRSLFVRVMES